MRLNLRKCQNDLTIEGLRQLRLNMYADSEVDFISWKSDFSLK
jgi:hypothetical protein